MKLTLLLLALAMTMSAQVLPGNASGVAMGHLHILTSDPAAQKKLWVDVLGGKPGKLGRIEYAVFPGVILMFGSAPTSGGTVGSIVDHLGFLVRDFSGMKVKLSAAAELVSENKETHQFFIKFPGDINVEFTEDTSLDVPVKHHHVHFATPDIEGMRSWYVTVFGAKPGVRGQFQAADLPGVNLSWKTAKDAPAPTKGRSLDHIGFEVKDIEALCSKAQAAGAKLEGPPRSIPELGLKVAFLVDPWGTRLELTEGLDKL